LAAAIVFWLLWLAVAAATGALMYAAATGPNEMVSNLSRWARRLGWRRAPAWLLGRGVDRTTVRGGAAIYALLLIAGGAWLLWPSQPASVSRNPPSSPALAPVALPARPGRHLDADLRNALLVHVPKDRQIRIMVLKDDAEADHFADEIETFLRNENYHVTTPRLSYAADAAAAPKGTQIYVDDADPNLVVIKIGMNDR
jgi:hypothetical protein